MDIALADVYIKTVLIMNSIAHKYMDCFITETNPKFQTRHNLMHVLSKIESVTKDIKALAGPEHVDEIRKEIEENWDVLAIHNTLGMMVQLTDEDRVKVENYAEELLKIKKR